MLNFFRFSRREFCAALRIPLSLSGEKLPFTVLRTINGELPVYKIYKGNGKIVNTVVKNVRGDLDRIRKELAMVCESPVKLHMGSVEIRGIHTWKVKEYLESIGI
jgi:large subunit ribosomal protein L49